MFTQQWINTQQHELNSLSTNACTSEMYTILLGSQVKKYSFFIVHNNAQINVHNEE